MGHKHSLTVAKQCGYRVVLRASSKVESTERGITRVGHQTAKCPDVSMNEDEERDSLARRVFTVPRGIERNMSQHSVSTAGSNTIMAVRGQTRSGRRAPELGNRHRTWSSEAS